MNVLKPHLQTTIWTLLRNGATQREIARVTGISRHTIRGYQKQFASQGDAELAGTTADAPAQTAPPWPPTRPPGSAPSSITSTCEPRRLVDSACARAIAEGVHSYRHVKTLTEKLVADALAAIDAATPVQDPQLSLIQEHPLIQSPDVYADLFARCAAQPILPCIDPSSHHDHE